MEFLKNTPVGRWVTLNQESENFGDALRVLVAYAVADWIRRHTGEIPVPEEALSRVLLARIPSMPLGKWLESPEEYCWDVVRLCERMKGEPPPSEICGDVPSVLDLRGVECPRNAARSRLVLAGYPKDRELEILLDEGSPIENVPSALTADGHTVVSREKKEGFWVLRVVRGGNKE